MTLFLNPRRRTAILYALVVIIAVLLAFINLNVALLFWGCATTLILGVSLIEWGRAQRASIKNESRLISRETRYRLTLSSFPEGVVLCRENWLIDWCNTVAQRHLSVNASQDAGRSIFDVIQLPSLTEYLQKGDFSQSLFLTLSDELILEVFVVVPDERHATIITHDITEQRRVDAMRKDFVANVSHELRTPLTVINGFLDLQCDAKALPASVTAYHLTLMRDQARRMRHLVDDLLILSRLEGKDEEDTEGDIRSADVIAMPKLLEDVLREAQALSMGRHSIELLVKGPALLGDPDEIRSAAINLASNAVRYTPEGGRITIEWCHSPSRGGAVLSVTDTGIGIASKDIPRLTERFYRVDKGRSRDTGGTGLGLAIVKHIARRHEGELLITSQMGSGSTFAMHFPDSRLIF